jgi:hypothetical protein
MARKHYRVDEVTRSLSKKHDVKIKGGLILMLQNKVVVKNKQGNDESVSNPEKTNDVGNGSWGKIDFLKSCGFQIRFVESLKDMK